MIVKTNMAAPDILISNGTNIKVPIETSIIEIEHRFDTNYHIYDVMQNNFQHRGVEVHIKFNLMAMHMV